jgi:hypothetical protein
LAVSGYVHGGESSILIGGVSMPFRTADQNREGRLANVGNVTTGGADYWIPGQLGGTLTIECPKQLAVLTGLALQGLYTATINFMTGVSRSRNRPAQVHQGRVGLGQGTDDPIRVRHEWHPVRHHQSVSSPLPLARAVQ